MQAQNVPKPKGRRRNSTDKAIVAATWSAGWILPFLALGAAGALHLGEFASGLAFLTGIAAYVGGGIIVTGVMGHEEASSHAGPPPDVRFHRTALLSEFARLQEDGTRAARRVAFLRVEASVPAEIHEAAKLHGETLSFRRIQEWVERTVREHGGEPHGTASEGLLALFRDDASAVRAARALQDGVGRFNAERNQAGSPLVLRCGLRAGDVAPPVDVWDLAGHPLAQSARELQQVATPGDVVVGPELAAVALTELGPIAPLPEPITGERVFSWRAAQP
jgi:hypothetical protein